MHHQYKLLLCGYKVSIRARPRGRAMPRHSGWLTHGALFQSAPGLEAGRCGRAQECQAVAGSFNPRPA